MSINRFDYCKLRERLELENAAVQWFHSRWSASEET